MHKIYFIICVLNFTTLSVFAQLSPGDLHKSHAFLDGIKNCTKCHSEGNKLSMENCLNCHSLLKQRINNNSGLHSQPEYKNCVSCHVDHLGRDYQLIYWGKAGRNSFDHSKTGYILEAAHSKLECEKCHTENHIKNPGKFKESGKDLNRTYLGLDRQCASCHHDEHRGQLGANCLSCHTMNKWREVAGFDHNKTRFRITGRHTRVKCIQCHKQQTDNKYADDTSFLKFKNIKFNTCQDCHRDVHNKKFGSNCKKCHNTGTWSDINPGSFDHNKTSYPLKGRHAYLKCVQCHKANQPFNRIKYQNCMDCHNDTHKGQFINRSKKGACEECHTVDGFSPSKFTIEMHQQCAYPLKGSHLAVPCIECHKGRTIPVQKTSLNFRFKNQQCVTCHEDVHNGTTDRISGLKGCELCHSLESWHNVNFDHDKTAFRLEGMHKQTNCRKCHKKVTSGSVAGSQFSNTDKNCSACHTDIHDGQFNLNGMSDCASCHSPVDWLADRFDHERDTQFSLKGAHQAVVCTKCHISREKNGRQIIVYKGLDRKCESCHGIRKKG